MIIFQKVTKVVEAKKKTARTILAAVDLEIPSNRRIALLGSTRDVRRLVTDLVTGIVMPTSGRVIRKARLSFPIGQIRGVSPDLSVRHNVAHIARLYGSDVQGTVQFVRSVLDIHALFERPYEELPAEARTAFGQIVGFALPFDVYVLSEFSMHRPGHFRDRCYSLFQTRASTAGLILPTANGKFAREHCDMALVVQGRKLMLFDSVEDGLSLVESHDGAGRGSGRHQVPRRDDVSELS